MTALLFLVGLVAGYGVVRILEERRPPASVPLVRFVQARGWMHRFTVAAFSADFHGREQGAYLELDAAPGASGPIRIPAGHSAIGIRIRPLDGGAALLEIVSLESLETRPRLELTTWSGSRIPFSLRILPRWAFGWIRGGLTREGRELRRQERRP